MWLLSVTDSLRYTIINRQHRVSASSNMRLHPLNLFRGHPEMRKIAMAYLHNKILTLNECSVREVNKHTQGKDEDTISLDDDYIMYHDRKSVINLLQHILPPVPRSDIMSEVELTMTIFGHRSYLEEREFSSKVIMDNSVWKKVGETVVKELIYLDNIYQEHFDGRSFLCSSCNDRLVVSHTYYALQYSRVVFKLYSRVCVC